MAIHWQDEHLAAELSHGARALFSTRRGGVSAGPFASLNLGRTTGDAGGDDPQAIATNRERLAHATGLGPAATLTITRQVHGADLSTDADPRDEADGHVTAIPHAPLTVLVADCLPVAIAGPGAVAMVHAGWRGLAAGILRRGAEQVAAARPGPLHAVIGPGIGVCCFEVGDEVRDAFAGRRSHPPARRGRHLDLKAIARRELLDAGVTTVEDCELCTHCEPELFFSHRRDGAATGRQAGVAWRS